MFLCDLPLAKITQSAIFFENNLILPAPTPQTAVVGLWSEDTNHDEPIPNCDLLILNLHVYNSREKHHLKIMDLLTNIQERKKDRISSVFQQ